ncbi:hypothetical protein B6U93_02935 [Candidatus Woesearchaeota archaeon ex4484_78]|nr:MAG: hypothetical protein B6U93_02935 [Candidatus Woesearchaeota archaeon ex4484_78]
MFERESELLNKDFEKILDAVGGKNAGNRLLDAIFERYKTKINKIKKKGFFKDIKLNTAFEIPVSFYKDFEKIALEKGFLNKDLNENLIPEFIEENKNYVSELELFLKENSEIFPGKVVSFFGKEVVFQEAFIRSSSTSEDFRRPELAGTSSSFNVSNVCDVSSYLSAFFDFFKNKFGDNIFEYDESEHLAFQVAEFISPENNFFITGTSEIIDGEKLVNIEVCDKKSDLCIRYKVNDNSLRFFYGFSKADENLFYKTIENKGSFLSKSQVLAIADLLRLKHDVLGYDIDAEYILTENDILLNVQLRKLAPVINKDLELEPVKGAKVLETPFVLRKKFSVEGYLLDIGGLNDCENAIDRLDYNIPDKIKKESILLIDKNKTGSKFHRSILESPYAGIIFSDGVVEISHSGIKGLTYLLKKSNNNIVAMPDIKDKMDFSSILTVSKKGVLRSEKKYKLVCDGRSAVLYEC